MTIDGASKKIRKADASDTYILGIVSATAGIIGDTGELRWKNKYITDKWGRIQYHEVTVPERIDEKCNVLVQAHTETHPILNPQWDANREYVSRLKRPEWVAVGLLGKLLLRDDGICQVGGYCHPMDGGVTTASQDGYRFWIDWTMIRF